MRPRGLEPVTPIERRLAGAIRIRRGNAARSTTAVVPPVVHRELRRAAELERAWPATIGPEHLPRLREILRRTDSSGFDLAPERLLVAVGSLHDTPLAQLHAGQAVQRVLLTATVAGQSAAHWTDVLTPASRRELRGLLGGGLWPQVPLCLGHGAPAPVPERAPLETARRARSARPRRAGRDQPVVHRRSSWKAVTSTTAWVRRSTPSFAGSRDT
ncbi:hypothetical protein [Amycolatopsis sp. FDAARGOS 1241]|uniref:hypothetical protein n=1 Tax=Amycolatopsis sp. FDAARGOS 1241 TaxID=2778070 RepID=UPI001950CEB4|nr:hypothetical protein [Amycolatopsis sp. FDAARGOS 1241]QRP49164.1 hypothetical protein I6J71_16100 [Amycolatopsis sp. FDAARGOS 1241]